MARLYSDENFPLPVVELLRGLGHDVLTAREETLQGKLIRVNRVPKSNL